ncbi:MAG: hypothetical protein NWT08_11080 [Akkermansiaceae bacterium]|jgi:hypothetical protein|nr:hypothetical protein [Akkermansiaceae bacterium]MDP4646001.1 hypothetical protein [Akkermansiaceae bacterium]MDP4721869.1 hypothetical protein [Akkermansiaceae bacterium]MDP4780121.1 hypothetical protein [Akkermansiaceae bacterium]MDP4848576.1 hypothetical protein [Akkermansiaceae bacterium]
MKTIFGLYVVVCISVGSLLSQDVPPAFESKGAGEDTGDLVDPFDPLYSAGNMIRVQTEFIEMGHKDLTRLMMEDKSKTSDATDLRMKVQDMVDEDKAKVIDTQMAIARSGHKALSQSRSEYIYPTEYEPFEFDVKSLEKSEKDKSLTLRFGPATPTAFETRNLGGCLEIEPTLSDDAQVVDLRLLPELTWHTGETVWSEFKDGLGNIHKISMPEFYTLEVNTAVTMIAGQYCLIGITSPKDAEGQMNPEKKVMVFVKCDVLPVVP